MQNMRKRFMKLEETLEKLFWGLLQCLQLLYMNQAQLYIA